MDSSLLKQYLTGKVEGMEINPLFLFYAGILMEIPISMILFSRILPDKSNVWANILASFIKTFVMIITLFIGSFTIYYAFFAAIEIMTTMFIFGYSIKWLREGNRVSLL
jgi:hypothetical protein